MGNVYIITMMDLFSGWPEAEGIPDKRAETVGLTFQRMFFVSAFLSFGNSLR